MPGHPPPQIVSDDGLLARYRSQAQDFLRWSGVAHWDFIVDEGVLNISAEFAAAYGYQPEELLPMTLEKWMQIIHPDDVHVASVLDKIVLERAGTVDIDFRMKTASGEWRHFWSRGGIAESSADDNNVIRISGTIQDITDQKLADAALRRRDRLLAAVNEAANILLMADFEGFAQSISQVLCILGTVTDVDRVYVWKNEWVDEELCCSQICEWSPHAEPQQGNEYTTRIKYRESVPTWEKQFRAGECVNNFVRNMSQEAQDQLSPQGIISILVAPIMFRDEFWGFIGFDDCRNERIWDQTETGILKSAGMLLASAIQRQTAEAKLARERKTLDWIIETSPTAILTSAKGKVSGLNKRSRELFAIKEGASLSELCAKILGRHQNAINRDLIVDEILKKGFFSRNDIQFLCADGTVHDFMLTSLLLDPESLRKSITWVMDVTDMKEAERALSQALNKAEIATKAKSDFLARMSHEIRTPMNAIFGMVYLCLQTDLNEKQRDYLTKTQSAANNLLGIINDILDVSKIESGKFELESVPFSLKETIEEVLGIVHVSAEEKGLKLIHDIDSEICDRLVGDPLRLRQILLNLTSNAIKFTKKGGVFVSVKHDDESWCPGDEKVCLAFEVKDTGIGLHPEQIENIFESFTQADGSTTRKYGGTGLGLAIVKSFVELMGGKVNVTSIPGQGTTFRFTVVFDQSQVVSEVSSAILLNKRRVMIIDDDENDLEILTNLLQSMRMDVSPLRTGAAALVKLEEASYVHAPFELVLIDWRMPRMDGIETVRQIRQNKKIVPPHILVVSAYDRQDCLRQVQGLNVADVLVKPVIPSVLKETLKTTFREDLTQKSQEIRADLRGTKILLAEDNKINQIVMSELLKILNVELTMANNGREAIEAVAKNDFDLILMDIQMPEMDGLEATQAIRNLKKPGIEKLPILAMTANALDTDYRRSLEIGMNDHLTKPIDPEKLRLALEKWIVR